MPAPILTTNYDTLIESFTGDESVTWRDTRKLQGVIAGTMSGVGHLHGVHVEPDTVVLGAEDYTRLLMSGSTVALEQALSSIKSLVYVGFGAGLADPNFSRLLSWHRQTFEHSAIKHFRLCKDDEVDHLRAIHVNDNIVPIAYGADYSSLPSFVAGLMPEAGSLQLTAAGVARDLVAEARDLLASQIRSDTIIGENLPDVGSLALRDLTVEPVLLPVPHADYVRERARQAGGDIERVDPQEEAEKDGILILVGEENCGLSTTLTWMVDAAAQVRPSAIPLVVNFRDRTKGSRPLDRLLKSMASAQGTIASPRDELPEHIFGIDDFSPFVRLSDAVLSEVAASTSSFIVIGCRSGEESEIAERLRIAGSTSRTLHLGRLGRLEIEAMARIATPLRSKEIAASVISVLRAENLPFTPFTIALLISIYLRGGEVVTTNASTTSVLDQYVGLLLGRGDPADDSRFSFDVVQREAILSDLARLYVDQQSASLPEADVIGRFAEFFANFGWKESPVDFLSNVVDRRVLRKKNGQVGFARNAFLYLFAAKRGLEDEYLRELISTKPLEFAPVVKNYAALSRRDAGLLTELGKLLDSFEEPSTLASAFMQVEATEEIYNLDRLFEGSEPGNERTGEIATPDEPPRDEVEREPFGNEFVEEAPLAFRFMMALDILSTALRDSDQVANLELKRALLKKALLGWGNYVSVLAGDAALAEVMNGILPRLKEGNEISDEKIDEFIDDLSRLVPAAIVMGGVGATLSSRRLLVILEQLIADADFVKEDKTAVTASMLLFIIREEGWAAKVAALLKGRTRLWIVYGFLGPIFYGTLMSDIEEVDVKPLADLTAELMTSGYKFATDVERRQKMSELSQKLITRRRLASARRGEDAQDLEAIGNTD